MCAREEYEKVAEVKSTYEEIALAYNRVRAKPWKECLDFIQSFKSGYWILDVGCGIGRHVLTSVLQGHETVGIDLSKNMLRIADKKLKSNSLRIHHLVLAEASHLPFKNGSFAYILHIATLHNLPSRSLRVRSLEEVERVLNSGGRCLISVWKRLQFRFLSQVITIYLRRIIGFNGDFEVIVPWKMNDTFVYRYFYLYSARQLRKDIEDARMNIQDFSKVKIGTRIIADNYFVTVGKPQRKEE